MEWRARRRPWAAEEKRSVEHLECTVRFQHKMTAWQCRRILFELLVSDELMYTAEWVSIQLILKAEIHALLSVRLIRSAFLRAAAAKTSSF